jgi:seryl-tRNA synthetase
VALVETYQQSDGILVVPPALRPYLKTERIQA